MRIISGKLRGLAFATKDYNARPTTDFARESLFNILNNYFDFESITALDLFAGTGGISFEFASRGTKSIHLVESDNNNYRQIVDDIKKLKIQGILPFRDDVFKHLERNKAEFDVVFADPPYNAEFIPQLPDLVLNSVAVKSQGWFVLEHSKMYHFDNHLYFYQERKYGAVHFSIFVKDKKE
jgi:16S rRNA (guanine(966)-N(2))-methyltransferase RsmD